MKNRNRYIRMSMSNILMSLETLKFERTPMCYTTWQRPHIERHPSITHRVKTGMPTTIDSELEYL